MLSPGIFLPSLVAVLSLLANITAADDVDLSDANVNCKGSGMCPLAPEGAMRDIIGYLNGLRNDAWYRDNQNLACYQLPLSFTGAAICAFIQLPKPSRQAGDTSRGFAAGQDIIASAAVLRARGCTRCGSAHLNEENDDHGSTATSSSLLHATTFNSGLTVNYVVKGCGVTGLCLGLNIASSTQYFGGGGGDDGVVVQPFSGDPGPNSTATNTTASLPDPDGN